MSGSDPDVVIVGGGHNAGVAAAGLARQGRRVIVCEARSRFGGAVAGERIFPGGPATLSRFSYLVSLLPDRSSNRSPRSRTIRSGSSDTR